MTIGTTGTPVASASSNAPVLKRCNSPLLERVPSGNIMIELPDSRVCWACFIICTTLSRCPRCSRMYRFIDMFQPISGTLKISALDTHLKSLNSRNSTRMSSKERWLAAST